MQTQLTAFIKQTAKGREAEAILRRCVHCGFCNANCPTYQLQGDELEGPRGRIYLIKQVLEGEIASAATQQHLDSCLNCLGCETACPSGVNYGRLLDIGREIVERQAVRPWRQALLRRMLLIALPYPRRFKILLRIARGLRPLLPERLQAKLPLEKHPGAWPPPRQTRRMLIMQGCVQPALAPGVDAAAARVLDRLGVSLIPVAASCCGAMPYHLGDHGAALDMMRRNIDACWPLLETGVEAIVSTASGCGAHGKDYGRLLANDRHYAEKAARISALTKDIGEILRDEDLAALHIQPSRVAFHAPCTLQHGQQLSGVVENILTQLGFSLTAVPDSHLCCGSAGAYSILQPELAGRLQTERVQALQTGHPQLIATANIGCLLYLREKAAVPVKHWIELLASD
ncbi:MAG: glycolate oxidase subunit GlcF [Methylomonas sp.]|jgi:glycolate oxidase iron-sulfur subunit